MPLNVAKDTEREIKAKVRSGAYHSADEVIRDALRLLGERDRLYALRLEELRGEVKQGLDQLDRGEGRPLDVGAMKKRLRTAVGRRTKRPRATSPQR